MRHEVREPLRRHAQWLSCFFRSARGNRPRHQHLFAPLRDKITPAAGGQFNLRPLQAASKLFDKLDRDHDGTLDRRELRGRVNAKDFAAADPDNDGTLDKNEFLALVEKRFKAADPDNDGTIDAKELKSAAGRSLVPLLK